MIKKKVGLILGITGQDGSYLAELLLEKGYEVHGMIRRSSSFNTQRINHIYDQLHLHYGDITDILSIQQILIKYKPDEIYNLSAQSHVQVSFFQPLYTSQVDGVGVLNLLESCKQICPNAKIYQASTSELYGKVLETPQTEKTQFNPVSPYGIAKQYAFGICKNYRESYNMFICNGILFNHESERRGSTFVTKKITEAFVKIKNGEQNVLRLGNLNAKRDWGYAPDYVYGMWLMLQQNTPDDFVLATGETHTIREFIEESAPYVGFDIEWIGEGVNEKGVDKNTGKVIIEIDPKYFRPSEVDLLLGDPTKAKNVLGWKPKVKFKELVKIMIEHDLKTGGKSLIGT
jgi:GDPmannose 4,6-dehydratase